jgi:uncharacterized protein with HEPN domain
MNQDDVVRGVPADRRTPTLIRLRREFRAVAARVPELREVVAFRNLISHRYDAVDHRVAGSLARLELPPLLAALRKIESDAT